ncbi:MAG: DUF2240 family protein [Candidatus Aenigmarchaeota archaeon]|nr:DUF2240 family protein [Candidatus Aenigmarchaeota archaeon]
MYWDEGYDKILEAIEEKTKIPKDKIERLVLEKQQELSGLVSREGAALIVGRELGVQLMKEGRRILKIQNLVPGLRSVDLKAKVIRLFEPREFERNGKKGSVMSVILGDETGTCRLSLWDLEIDTFRQANIAEGMTIEVRSAFVKPGYQDKPDLRIGRGTLKILDEPMEVAQQPDAPMRSWKRSSIRELKENDFCEVRASMLQFFERQVLYETCPTCLKRVTAEGSAFKCQEHGPVTPSYLAIAAGFADDGTGSVRVVFFREAAEKVLGKSIAEIKQAVDKEKNLPAAFQNVPVGREYVIRGRVKRNTLTGSLEIVTSQVEDIDTKTEAERILQSMPTAAG